MAREIYLRNKAELVSWGYTVLSINQARISMYNLIPQQFTRFIFVAMSKIRLDIFSDELKASLVEEKIVKSIQHDRMTLINDVQLNFWLGRDVDRFRGLDRTKIALVFVE